jgi:hypothetical protein
MVFGERVLVFHDVLATWDGEMWLVHCGAI